MKFARHTLESAPSAVKPELEAAQKKFGTIFNLYRGMADSPAMLKVYMAFNEVLGEHGQLTPIEQQVAYLTFSAENGCTYCVGAHSALANMVKMPTEILSQLRDQQALSDPKLDAVRNLSLAILEKRGWVSDEELETFASAGFEQTHVLEILTILAQKTMSNYFNHLARTPLDDMFKPVAWQTKS